jgi:hypothetical protein
MNKLYQETEKEARAHKGCRATQEEEEEDVKIYGGVHIHIFLTSVLLGHEWSASRFGHITPDTRWIGGCLDPRVTLNYMEKKELLTLPGLELRPLGRPDRNQSLYRLSYPGSLDKLVICSSFQSLNPGPDEFEARILAAKQRCPV